MKRASFSWGAALLVVALPGCAEHREDPTESTESNVTGVPQGEIRGVVDVSNTFRTRILDEANSQTAGFDISRVAGPVFRLRRQLGVFAVEGTSTTYLGGLPTPLRMTLWHQVFGRTATAMGEVCNQPGTAIKFEVYAIGLGATTSPTTFRLHPRVEAKIRDVCTFAGDEAAHRLVTSAFFDTVMGAGSTLAAERAAFVEAFAGPDSASAAASPVERVTNMSLALLLNPHFLLAK